MSTPDLTAIQQAKNDFAAAQDPPIQPCTNAGCQFTQCTCESDCGCGSVEGKSCDPCREFKQQKQAAAAAANK